MNEKFYRNSCKRQHRIIGHYLALQAWLRGLDCIVLSRHDLEFFLGLRRFKSIRVIWLQGDLQPWFQNQVPYYSSKAPSSISCLFLSRVIIEPHLPKGRMTTSQRLSAMKPGSPRADLFLDSPNAILPTEAQMISQLAMFSSGVAVPQEFSSHGDSATKSSGFFDAFDIFQNAFGRPLDSHKSPDA
jgi:hypothetical protein